MLRIYVERQFCIKWSILLVAKFSKLPIPQTYVQNYEDDDDDDCSDDGDGDGNADDWAMVMAMIGWWWWLDQSEGRRYHLFEGNRPHGAPLPVQQ